MQGGSVNPYDLFEILAREHADMLSVYLRCIVRDNADVDDIFQETMLVAWKRLPDFDRSRSFGPWLRGIAGRIVMAHRREAARAPFLCDEGVLERLGNVLTKIRSQPGDTLDERLAALRECMGDLPEQARSTVQLRYEQKLSRQEIADELTLPVETVKKRLQRARAQLLDCIQRKLDTP